MTMLADQIRKQMLAAMKAGNVIDKQVLGVALGEIQTAEARAGKSLSDEEAQAVVKKLVKANEETLEVATNTEQQRALRQELTTLKAFLPTTLSADQIASALAPVADAIRAAKNDGQATGVAMKHLKAEGAAVDGKDVAQAVKQLRG
jgi:uncharacterized protein